MRLLLNLPRFSPASSRFYHSKQGAYGFPPEISSGQKSEILKSISKDQAPAALLIDAFRTHGYRKAVLDPLGISKKHLKPVPELELGRYGLSETDRFDSSGLIQSANVADIKSLRNFLHDRYCNHLTAEFMHLDTLEERDWFAENYEGMHDLEFTPEQKKKFSELMLKCQNFDHFLATKFSTVKRYGGEGAESAMVFYWQTFLEAAKNDIKEIVICMAHRGRLNLLTGLLQFSPVAMFNKMKGKIEFPTDISGSGDVLSHLVSSLDVELDGKKLHLTLMPNPSHLEAVNPVAVGKARGKMQSRGSGDYGSGRNDVLCLQIHGDASFAGQGIVPETLMLSELPHFKIGGSIHLIINNQLGYTTESERGRSSNHCSDLAKANNCPVIHVNGDSPEGLAKSAILSLAYREAFGKDIFVDFLCYRRWGHNEMDDPSFTQPLMYSVIDARKSTPDIYSEQLINDGVMEKSEVAQWLSSQNQELSDEFGKLDSYQPTAEHLTGKWKGFVQAPRSAVEVWDTGVDTTLLKFVGKQSVTLPKHAVAHPHLLKMHCGGRIKRLEEGSKLDWSTAEAMAFGSLLLEDYSIRICGQDVGRGTFSHRHVMLVDNKTDEIHIPLNRITPEQKSFIEVVNSPLSEEAVLGFEYGMSLENPRRLCIWEAQFGDFFNGAQIIIDTFIASGESLGKWLTQSGLVMLLPHGYDGMGPEHSSCRIERFLQLTDSREAGPIDGEDVNFQFAHPTTSAQYFHLLRRQMVRNYRKPLVVASPKLLLRFPDAMSPLTEFGPGTHFKPVLSDISGNDPASVKKVIVCSGKHFYALEAERKQRNLTDCAIIRLEALSPFPAKELDAQLRKYPQAQQFLWSQEEPRNMGPWFFVNPRCENILGVKLQYAGRPELPLAATAIGSFHKKEHDDVIAKTFA